MAHNTILAAQTAAAAVTLDLSKYLTTQVIVHGLAGSETISVEIGTSAGFVAFEDAAGAPVVFNATLTMFNLPTGLFRLTKGITVGATGIDTIYGQTVVTH